MIIKNFRPSFLCVYIVYQSLWLSQPNRNSYAKYFHNSIVQTFKIWTLNVSAVIYRASSDTNYFQKITINSFVVETSQTIGPFRLSQWSESIGQLIFTFQQFKNDEKCPYTVHTFCRETFFKNQSVESTYLLV